MKPRRPSLIKYVNNLYRYTQAYTDERLKKFGLSSGTYPFLLRLYEKEGISQNQISKELNVDKAMSARSIKKLIELGYIKKDVDKEDCRAYKLYLTDSAKDIIPEVISEIDNWINIITEDSNEKEYETVINFLSNSLIRAKEYRKK